MSDTTALRLAPVSTLFGRLMALIDRLLMANARSPIATAICLFRALIAGRAEYSAVRPQACNPSP